MKRLLIRPGAIGDFILSLPTIEWFAKNGDGQPSSPSAVEQIQQGPAPKKEPAPSRADYTEVWAPRVVLPLVRFADRTRAIADTGLDLLGVVEGATVPDLSYFDSIYSWYGSNRAEFRDAVKHLPFTFLPAFPCGPGVPRIPVPDVPREDFVVIHPFASSVKKHWPMDNFREVAARLGRPVRWCAGPEEPLEDAVRFDDLYELGCWISRASLYIGNDSGISHLAAAVGTPVIAIFLATDPVVWAPRGPHVRVLERPSVDEVVACACGSLKNTDRQ